MLKDWRQGDRGGAPRDGEMIAAAVETPVASSPQAAEREELAPRNESREKQARQRDEAREKGREEWREMQTR